MKKKQVISYIDSVCAYCGKISKKRKTDVNRYARLNKPLCCSRKCGLLLRGNKHKSLENILANTVKSDSGCMEWQGRIDRHGYGVTYWSEKFGYHQVLAHRAVFILINGEIESGLFVCHSCDNRKCINPDHLWLGTALDNTRDMINKGRDCFHKRIISASDDRSTSDALQGCGSASNLG